jgi:SAM-dependent methyltransferase
MGYEVMAGFLLCPGCGHRYAINEGVPQLCHPDLMAAARAKVRTASSYGYLWSRSAIVAEVNEPRSYHFDRMERALSLPPLSGLVLDAGCGEGIDLANQARRAEVEIVGVELSDGGCRTSFARSLALPAAHVIQADLCRLPFEDKSFDFVYSYGVLHHLPSPKEGLQELVRLLKPGACVAAYLYEDFSDRAIGWRWLLAGTNQLRWITLRLSHRVLYLSCQAASPAVYALFTIPFRMLRHIPGLGSLASGFPFRHATRPFSLVGDLYDRFSAPIEWRYSRGNAIALFESVGLQNVAATKERGWMVSGIKPSNG